MQRKKRLFKHWWNHHMKHVDGWKRPHIFCVFRPTCIFASVLLYVLRRRGFFSLSILQNQHTRELISAWKTSHKHNKDRSQLHELLPGTWSWVNTQYTNSTRGASSVFCRINTQALEKGHTNTTTKTGVAYGNSHLGHVSKYKVHKLHQKCILSILPSGMRPISQEIWILVLHMHPCQSSLFSFAICCLRCHCHWIITSGLLKNSVFRKTQNNRNDRSFTFKL